VDLRVLASFSLFSLLFSGGGMEQNYIVKFRVEGGIAIYYVTADGKIFHFFRRRNDMIFLSELPWTLKELEDYILLIRREVDYVEVKGMMNL
jgi:hypothetical protein